MKRISVLSALLLVGCGSGQQEPEPVPRPQPAVHPGGLPVTPERPVTNTYHGVDVVDPYQWLEADTDEVKAWAAAQNAYARKHLDALPNLPAVAAEIKKLALDPSPSFGSAHYAAGKLFMKKRQPPAEQAVLVVFDDADELTGDRVLLDPTVVDDEGTTSIDWFVPSPDGTLVAVSLSRRGSERGDLSIYKVKSGNKLGDVIEHVSNGTAGGDLTWAADSRGFYYTRYPRAGERPDEDREFYQQLWYHELGTAAADDRYELGKGFPRIAQIKTRLNRKTGELLATVQNGDGGDIAHYLRAPGGSWTQLSSFGDGTKSVLFMPGDRLLVFSRRDAPRGKLLATPAGSRDLGTATELVAQGDGSISWMFWQQAGLVVTDNRIYVVVQRGGPSAIKVYDHAGKALPGPGQGDVVGTRAIVPLAGDDILYKQSTDLEPGGWYRLRAAGGAGVRQDSISKPALVDFSDTEVIRELATSRDGTQVPLNIVVRKDHPRDGSRPCVVNGYGGYGISMQPGYKPFTRLYLDRGTCYVYTNLRGGGEFGEAWHRAGMLTEKQNVFDDFAAVLRHLVARGYTSHERLGIIGASNGGLLMGATFTQHPELVRAVVSAVGIYDSLRVELSPNGEFNITEFGTVKDPEQFKALHAYSPYHGVEKGAAYPAILFVHGDNDPRVSPWQSRKMVARVQAATSSDRPVLLRTSGTSGHRSGNLSEAISAAAHQFAFLLHHLGAE